MISARPGRGVLAVLSIGLLTASALGPARAQEKGDRLPTARALQDGVQVRLRGREPGMTAPDGATVDESALRYYASRGDQAKVDAEIARLRALHPDWQPPVDLYGPVALVDEQPLWDLYDQQDYAGARRAIAELVEAHPEWQPPAKLLDLIEENEVRARLQALEQTGQWQPLLDVAAAHPGQIGCARIDNLWRVARAHHELGHDDQVVEVYAQIIESCDQVDHRIATLEKAKSRVDDGELDELFALEQTRSKPRRAARQIAKLREAEAPKTPAAIQELFGDGVDLSMVEDGEAEVVRHRHAAGAERLGWLYFDAERWWEASRWFRRAQRWQPKAGPAQGLARAYAKLGKPGEVEALAAQWPEAVGPLVEELRRSWIVEAFERGDHAMLLAETEGRGEPWARNLRAWSYAQLARPTEASRTFALVLNDDQAPPSARREAAYGLARAQIAIGALRDAEAIVAAHEVSAEQRYEIYAEVLSRRAQRAFTNGDHRGYLLLMEERRGFAEPTRAMLLQEAWARYHMGQKQIAKRIFERLHRVYATKETREGLRVVSGSIDRIGL